MSSVHLSVGSTRPAKVEGKLRLYSMQYCPYAQRTRLVLLYKNIPHDIVNVNLTKKPEWLTEVHPEGKVPALETDSGIVVESLDICNYLDEKYPFPAALYPAEPHEKEQQKALLEKIGPLAGVLYSLVTSSQKKSAEEWLKDFKPHLDIFEEALSKTPGDYFGGSSVGMVDLMLWPWAERSGAIAIHLGEKLPLAEADYPKLRAWKKAMKDQEVAKATFSSPEIFLKLVDCKMKGVDPGYDNLNSLPYSVSWSIGTVTPVSFPCFRTDPVAEKANTEKTVTRKIFFASIANNICLPNI